MLGIRIVKQMVLVATVVPLTVAFAWAQQAQTAAHRDVDPHGKVPALRAEMLKKKDDTRVFGGRDADPGEWPFQVAIMDTGRLSTDPESQYQSQFCGGSLIAPQWVLTAAHCLSDGEGNLYAADSNTVLVGTTTLTGGKRYAVVEAIVHENYNPTIYDNDVGLLKLAEPVTDVPIVRLVDNGAAIEGAVTVLGWGLRRDGSIPLDLQEADFDVVSNDTCNAGIKTYYTGDYRTALEYYGAANRVKDGTFENALKVISEGLVDPISEVMLCAGTKSGEIDACHGDSGGPLLAKDSDGKSVQVGIVSWGAGPANSEIFCGFENAYGVYSKIGSRLRDWIKEKSGV